MARVYRPPPPPPAHEPETEEQEDNYIVWSDNEFDDGGDVYLNCPDAEVEEDEAEDEFDYETPDDPSTIPGIPLQPPIIPPRQQARTVPPPATVKPDFKKPDYKSSAPLSNQAGKHKAAPVHQVTEEEYEETYEVVDNPLHPEEECEETYEVVDNAPPVTNNIQSNRARALPPVPQPGAKSLLQKPDVKQTVKGNGQMGQAQKQVSPLPTRKDAAPSPLTKPSNQRASPVPSKKEVPLPPPLKPSSQYDSALPLRKDFLCNRPAPGKFGTQMRQSPQVSPLPSPPPPEPEDEENVELYEGGEFYAANAGPQKFPAGQRNLQPKPGTKPLPKPPIRHDDPDDEEADEDYTEVTDSTIGHNWKTGTADRPIPPIPSPSQYIDRSSPPPAEESELAMKLRAALAKREATKKQVDVAVEPEVSGTINGSSILDIKKHLKPVNRGESMPTLEKAPKGVNVKRTESESTKRQELVNNEHNIKPWEAKNRCAPKNDDKPISKLTPNKLTENEETATSNKNHQPVGRLNNPFTSSPIPSRSPVAELKNRMQTSPLPPARGVSPVPKDNSNFSSISKTPNSNFKPPASKINIEPPPVQRPTPPTLRQQKDTQRSPLPDRKPLPVPAAGNDSGDLQSCDYYFSQIQRATAEQKILDMKQDGSFMVRKSQRGGETNPYTLTTLFKGFIYNLHIRKRPDKNFALGSEKPNENTFCSVPELIKFHKNNPIELIGDERKNATSGKVYLQTSPRQ